MATVLDDRYLVAINIQELFRDRDTGLPLRSGYVEFFKDQDRVTHKPIYKLDGAPGTYNYVALPNPTPLTGIGTTSDGSTNDIPWYYYPYDDNGELELYYLRVYSSAGVFQFERQAWPNVVGSGSLAEDIINYIPNGQFLFHNNLPAISPYAVGQVRNAVTDIAQGGWTFNRPSGSTATDFLIFDPISGYTSNPTGKPKFVLNFKTTSIGGGDAYKDLRINFNDVNKFASSLQKYTFYFEGQVNSGGSSSVSLVLIKNFGDGGSSTSEQVLTTFILGNSYASHQLSFVFGTNEGKTIGDNSQVTLALRFQNSIQDISVINFILTSGELTLSEFPDTTEKDTSARTMVIDPMDYDGYDIGLPMITTLQGSEADYSVIGDVVASYKSTKKWHHLADGKILETAGYQDTGVPNARLQQFYWNTSSLVPAYGTGDSFATAQISSNISVIRLRTNTGGAVTAASDGAIPTGFTFSSMAAGATDYGIYCPLFTGGFYIWNIANGGFASDIQPGTSGFTVAKIFGGNPAAPEVSSVIPTAAAGLAGKYFKYFTTPTTYYVWFKVDGTGTDPAPGGTGILVNLTSDDNTPQFVANKIFAVLNGYQVNLITCTVATTVNAGSYFNFNVTGGSVTAYYVWYRKDGAGSDPTVSGRKGIVVDIASTDVASDICRKTVVAINSLYFSVPDYRGQFLRAVDIQNNYDKGNRYSWVEGIYGNMLGTYEFSSNLAHSHTIPGTIVSGTGVAQGASGIQVGPSESGVTPPIAESRPYNTALNFFVHY